MESLIIVQTTLPDAAVAETLASALVERHLAACVQIAGPIVSMYRWHGKVEKQQEFLLTAKICRNNYSKVDDFLVAHHPYDVPEVVAFPVTMVNAAYLRWAVHECSPAQEATP